MNRKIKLILPASEIPVNSTVTKKTGTSEFIIVDSVTFFKEGGDKQVIKSEDGTRFLIPGRPSDTISSINGKSEVVWLADFDTVSSYFEEIEEDTN